MSPALNPATWTDLLAAHAAKNDIVSARTLMVVAEGVEQLAAVSAPNGTVKVSRYHASIFERLFNSFNNPVLLKEVGLAYMEYQLPGVALKHFDLARQFAPRSRDIEPLQKMAMLALGQIATDEPSHSTLADAAPEPLDFPSVLHKATSRIPSVEALAELRQSAGTLEAKAVESRKTRPLPEPTARHRPDFRPLLEQAVAAIDQTDFSAAEEALKLAAAAGAPLDELMPLYGQLGLVAFNHDRHDEALHAYRRMCDLAPDAVEGWFNCALVHQRRGEAPEALAAYQRAALLDPDSGKIFCNLGSVWFELGDHVNAEAAARRAVELRPDYARAWDNLAAILAASERLDEAADACRKAIQIQPAFHAAWFKLGLILFQQENYIGAQEALSLTGDSHEFFAYVLYYMAMIESRRGRLDEAIKKLAEARAVEPAHELEISALRELASAAGFLARYNETADFYSQIVARKPDDISAWLGKGTAHHRAEQFDEARAAYTQITELDPNNSGAWHNLGLLASDLDDQEEACRCFQRETDLAPDDAKAWYDLGVCFQTLNRMEEADAAFERSEMLVHHQARKTSDLSAALSIVHRLNLGGRMLKS